MLDLKRPFTLSIVRTGILLIIGTMTAALSWLIMEVMRLRHDVDRLIVHKIARNAKHAAAAAEACVFSAGRLRPRGHVPIVEVEDDEPRVSEEESIDGDHRKGGDDASDAADGASANLTAATEPPPAGRET